ncbi:phosphotriesterase family protein [Microbacterium hibisci]|uniref:phosphotriesterase family protein n=1 Tax=Microbacterium hibisci TaxID=2036000 RepID=UPI001945692A|nr:hypothetical protein [Microbacterium hibisci]
MSIVRTVTGDMDPGAVGHVQPHEHVLSNLSLPPEAHATPSEVTRQRAPITLGDYYRIRREHTAFDLEMTSVDDAIEALREYRAAGGTTIVDVTSRGMGRDHLGLRRVAEATGVAIVMGSGYYYADYHPAHLERLGEREIADEIVADIVEGVSGSGIRAGVIGEIGMSWPHTPAEERVLRAAANAQCETGAALVIHPARHIASPRMAVEAAIAAGATPGKIVVSHIERTLFRLDDMRALAELGCTLSFDLFGQEMSYYSLGDIDMPNDAGRIRFIRELIAAGHREQILISQDVCHRTNQRKYGGEGYTHLLEHVLPQMQRRGLSDQDIVALTVDNPARLLTIDPNERAAA